MMTFVSVGQFSVFTVCVAFGLVLGAAKCFFTASGKIPLLQAAIDFSFFLLALPAFAVLAFFCRFPDFRPYMAVGVLLGFFACRKFLRQSVAKPLVKWYNQRKSRRKAQSRP